MDLYQKLLHESVGNVDYRDLISVPGRTTVQDAITSMKEHRVGCVVIVDDDGHPLGTFTERLVVKLLLSGGESMEESVVDHMLAPPAIVRPGASVVELIDCMERSKRRFVCVVDQDEKAIAVVGQKGVVKFLASHYPQVVHGNAMESTLHIKTREGA